MAIPLEGRPKTTDVEELKTLEHRVKQRVEGSIYVTAAIC